MHMYTDKTHSSLDAKMVNAKKACAHTHIHINLKTIYVYISYMYIYMHIHMRIDSMKKSM